VFKVKARITIDANNSNHNTGREFMYSNEVHPEDGGNTDF